MNPIPLSLKYEEALPAIAEFIRRSIDGTTKPLFVDYTNNRVLIGSTAASTTPGTLEVAGDIKVTVGARGLIIPNRSGTTFYRLGVDNDGALYADPVSSALSGTIEVAGDVKITVTGKGLVLLDRAGVNSYRVIMENDGTISADPL